MELDDLKQPWEESTRKIKPLNTNIMELIQNKSNGPLEKLKRSFKRPMVLLPIVAALLINNLSRRHDILSDALFWLYIATCVALISYFYYSYRMVTRMQAMDGMVRATLEKQVQILEMSVKRRLLFIRVMAVVFIAAVEILMYYQQEPSFARWYAQPLLLRLCSYIAVLLVFYFFTGFVIERRYSKHIHTLKDLVTQMQ